MIELPYFLDAWHAIVEKHPDNPGLVDGATGESVTIRQADERSGRIYRYLSKNGIGKEDFVMICMPRGINALLCMLGVWKSGAAFTLVEDTYAPDRIAYIRKDIGCKVFLDQALFDEMMREEPLMGYKPTEPHDAAFAVYTSGSTGFPKGVLHEYGNIAMNALAGWRKGCPPRLNPESRYAIVSPLNFIASVSGYLALLRSGAAGYILPYAVVKNPLKLNAFYLEHKITDCFFSPSMLRVVGHDLSPYLKHIFMGSEPANGISVEGPELINTYSMSEGAFTVAQFVIDRPYDVAPVGKPSNDFFRLYLLDEEGNEVPDGEMGEIAFKNPYMRGYINLPEQTKKAMRNGLYHTGDLARRLPDGNLILLGRANDMIKINGNRIEPAEIEKAVKETLGIRHCVAKGFEDPRQSFICVYYTEDVQFDPAEVKEKLKQKLPYYMIPSYFEKIDAIPILPNGKTNKKVLKAPDIHAIRREYTAPKNALEASFCKLFESVLKLDRVGANEDFFELGGNSLSVMELLAASDMDDLSADDIFKGGTAEKIAALYQARIEKEHLLSPEEFELNARKAPQEAFQIQRFALDMQLYSAKRAVWNLPFFYSFEDISAADRLCAALNQVVQSAPVFGTVFEINESSGVSLRYRPEKTRTFAVAHLSEEEFEAEKKRITAPFDKLLGEPLYRGGIYVVNGKGYFLLVIQHIIIDGMGVQVFFDRLGKAYRGEALPLDTYYTCMALAAENKGEKQYQAAKQYMDEFYNARAWSNNIINDITDGSNTKNKSKMLPIPFEISKEQITAYEKKNNVTRSQLLTTAGLLTLAIMNQANDVLMSSYYHGRVDYNTQNALGLLMKLIPTALTLGEMHSLSDIYRSVKKQSADTMRYSNYEWAASNEESFLNDSLSMTYETAAIMNGGTLRQLGMKQYAIESDDYAGVRAVLIVYEMPDAIRIILSYSMRFYSDALAERFADTYARVLKFLLEADAPDTISIDTLLDL